MRSERLYVCETCVRDAPPDEDGRPLGRRLAAAIEAELARRPALEARLLLRRVHCLNACLSPCSVALRAPGKASLRFSRLALQDASAVLDLAALYCAAPDGEPVPESWPPALAGKNSARTPPLRP